MIHICEESYKAILDNELLGYIGETNSRTIEFEQPTVAGADSYKLRLRYGDGAIYDVPIVNNKVIVTSSLLRQVGYIDCQWVAIKIINSTHTLVAKSNIFKMKIAESLGETAIPSYEAAEAKLKEVEKLYNNIKKSAFENAMYEANYIEHPVELKIPGNVEYVKDRLYMSGVSTDQTSQGSYYAVPTLRKLTFEEGVKQIGDKAFKGQKYLDRIEFPDSLEWVHGEAFDDTEWLERQPEEVYCGQNVFYRLNNLYKNPTDQSRPPSHYEPPIRTVEIKKGTKTISAKAFRGHDRNINCDEIYHVGKLPGLMYLEEISLPSTLTGIGDEAFALIGCWTNNDDPSNSNGTGQIKETLINIPDTVSWIGKNAFYNSRLEGLRIPKSLTVIQEGTFYQSWISGDLIIPENVKMIGSRAFACCSKLTSIKLHKGIEYIGYNAFSYCSNVTEMWLPSGLNMRTEYYDSSSGAPRGMWGISNDSTWGKIYSRKSAFAGMTSLTTLHTEPDFDYGVGGSSGYHYYLDFSESPLSTESLTELIVNLKDHSLDNARHVIRLGSSNIAKLSDNLKLVASQKNWGLVS